MAQTIPGGVYRGVDGLLHDANGIVIQERPVEVIKAVGEKPAEAEHAADVAPASPKKKK